MGSRSKYSQWYAEKRWRAIRAAFLAENPLCVMCEAQGKAAPATICDHIEPHKGDRALFWSGPFQALCKYHHDVKTIMEDGGLNSGASNHPEWLPKPACPVITVCGPPGAGKTTWCRDNRQRWDAVIDLDDYFIDLCGVHGHDADRQYLNAAIRLRNSALADLTTKRQGRALFIASAPAQAERDWWQAKLGGEVVLVDPGKDVCLARVAHHRRNLVVRWYEQAQANAWRPKRAGCDLDGIPADPNHPWHGEG
jgi:5-methylcytosine-specific restriction protein A